MELYICMIIIYFSYENKYRRISMAAGRCTVKFVYFMLLSPNYEYVRNVHFLFQTVVNECFELFIQVQACQGLNSVIAWSKLKQDYL